jgi:hypothetical protein
MTTINEETIFHYTIGNVNHTIKAQAGSSLLLDEKGLPIVNQSHMKKMNRLFKSWIKFADKHSVKWVCQGGTLLGAARESKGHLFWDDDIDVNVLDYDKLYDLCGVHGEYILEAADSGFNYHHISGGYPFLDIWVLARRDSKKYIMAGPFAYKQPSYFLSGFWPKEYMYKKEFDNRIKVPFEDYEVYVPANYIELVKRQFCHDILTNYYYDPTKEIHCQMVENWIYNNFFSLKNRVRAHHAFYELFDYKTYKYIYKVCVNYSNFCMNEKLLNQIVDEYVQEKTYWKPIVLSSAKMTYSLLDPIFKLA